MIDNFETKGGIGNGKSCTARLIAAMVTVTKLNL